MFTGRKNRRLNAPAAMLRHHPLRNGVSRPSHWTLLSLGVVQIANDYQHSRNRFGNPKVPMVTIVTNPFRRSLILALALTILMAMVSAKPSAAENQKILILHDYHQGLAWTDSVSRGVQSIIAPLNQPIELYFHYLDIKRRPQPISESALLYALKNRLKQTAFDLIIAAGDEAFELVRRISSGESTNIPLVFCGITQFEPHMTVDPRPMTGVLKSVDHQANLDLMLHLQPQCRRMVVIFDWAALENEPQGALAKLLAAIPSRIVVDIWSDPDLDHLPARLQDLTADDLVYMLAVNRDKNLTYLHSYEALHLVSGLSPAPIFSPLEDYLGQGVVGGKITSGFRQGQLAAQLALRIICGEPAESIPVSTQSPNPYVFDHRQLERHGIKSSDLPPESIIEHQPPAFWVRWGKIISLMTGAVALVAVVLLSSILMLLKNRNAWSSTRADMENRLKEKTVHLKLLNHKLKRQSLTDSLTGLANRRYTLQRFAEEVKKARRYGTALTIALLDLDHFKQINTEFGYAVGDQIIRDVARAIRHCLREIDLVGRFSGEAFLIILPNTDLKMARSPMQRIFDTIKYLQWEDGQVCATLSGGLVEYDGQTLSQLTTEAEECQREAKAQGGNRFLPREE